ncbi:hypothetical protein ACHAWF_007959 [Thalassiosira exigua]
MKSSSQAPRIQSSPDTFGASRGTAGLTRFWICSWTTSRRRGVEVTFCRRNSADGTFRRLEFIDVEKVGDSGVPQYNLANLSGKVIRTYYTKLEFPNGVTAEEMKLFHVRCQLQQQWGGCKNLKENIPIYAETMPKEQDLMEEYKGTVDRVVAEGEQQIQELEEEEAQGWTRACGSGRQRYPSTPLHLKSLLKKQLLLLQGSNLSTFEYQKTGDDEHGDKDGGDPLLDTEELVARLHVSIEGQVQFLEEELGEERPVSSEREGALHKRLEEATLRLSVIEDEMSALLLPKEAEALKQLQASENLDLRTKESY